MTEQIEEHILRRYEIVKKIGSGAYGHVWKVKDKKTEQVLALKKIFDAFQHSTDAQRTYRQIMFLRQFEHENIIKLHQVYRAENDKDVYLVFECMQADLHNVIRQNILQDIHKQYIVYQIGLALKYLHSGEVIHRDLKPSNVLLNSECFVKLCDFGLVRSIAKTDEHCPVLTEYVATRWYRAPQILLGANDYSKAVDMWSLGCIVAEIILGKPIFPGTSTLHQLQKILSFTNKPSNEDIDSLKSDLAKSMIDTITNIKYKPPREWFPYCSEEMLDLVCNLLHFNPNKRMTAQQLLKHPYVKQFTGKGCQINSGKVFKIVNDGGKLTTKDYRALIYESVKEDRNLNKYSTTTTSSIQSTQKPLTNVRTTSPKFTTPGEFKTLTSGNGVRQPTTFTTQNSQLKAKKVEQFTKDIQKYTAGTINKKSIETEDIYSKLEQDKMKSVSSTGVLKSPYKTSTAFLSPKARITSAVSPSVKPNSPTYKYIYGTSGTEPQQELQPYFSSIKKKI